MGLMLLVELGRADTATLARLFGSPSAPADTSPACVPANPAPAELPAASVWSKPGVEMIDLHLPAPKWANAYRISPPHRSVFPRQDPFRSGQPLVALSGGSEPKRPVGAANFGFRITASFIVAPVPAEPQTIV